VNVSFYEHSDPGAAGYATAFVGKSVKAQEKEEGRDCGEAEELNVCGV